MLWSLSSIMQLKCISEINTPTMTTSMSIEALSEQQVTKSFSLGC